MCITTAKLYRNVKIHQLFRVSLAVLRWDPEPCGADPERRERDRERETPHPRGTGGLGERPHFCGSCRTATQKVYR